MLNLVNRHDFASLASWIRRGHIRRLLRLLEPRASRRVAQTWSLTSTPSRYWHDIPAVRRRWNRMISGDPARDHCAWVLDTHLAGRSGLHLLSLGCGGGTMEIPWAASGRFAAIHGYDVSPERIDYARRLAREAGLDGVLRFETGDARALAPALADYDVVLFEHALHHFSPLESVLDTAARRLRPGGLLVFNEFVGPTRFQWTDRQLAAVNALLALLPERYRRRADSTLKAGVHRPSRLKMWLVDPSEAIESGRILPLVRERFEVLDLRPYGGTLLHLLFADIGQHFLDDSPQTRRLLDLCFAAEDALLDCGDIASDFAVAVCRRRD